MKIEIDVAVETGTILAKDIPPGRIAKVDARLYLIRTSYIDSEELIGVWPKSGVFESIPLNSTLSVTLLPIGTKLTCEF